LLSSEIVGEEFDVKIGELINSAFISDTRACENSRDYGIALLGPRRHAL
jgi:hypothetical protein